MQVELRESASSVEESLDRPEYLQTDANVRYLRVGSSLVFAVVVDKSHLVDHHNPGSGRLGSIALYASHPNRSMSLLITNSLVTATLSSFKCVLLFQ